MEYALEAMNEQETNESLPNREATRTQKGESVGVCTLIDGRDYQAADYTDKNQLYRLLS